MKERHRRIILRNLKQDIIQPTLEDNPSEVLCANCRTLARNLQNGAAVALEIMKVLETFIPALPEKMLDDKGYQMYDKKLAIEDLKEATAKLQVCYKSLVQLHDDFYLYQVDEDDSEDYEDDQGESEE